MKVLVIATWYPSQRDPVAGVFVQDQVQALAAHHDVAVIAPDHLSLRSGVGVAREGRVLVARPRFLIPPIRWLGWNRISSFAYRAAVNRAYRTLIAGWGRPDIIHAHVSFPGGWCAASIGESEIIPVVVTEHTGNFAQYLTPRFRRDATIWTLNSIAATVAVSEGLARQLREAVGVDSVVVANAFDTTFFVPKAREGPARPFRLLTVGALRPVKGIDILLSALRIIHARQVQDWELVVGGAGPEADRLADMVRRFGLEEKVRFVGRLARSQVRSWMQWTDVLVLASRYENLPGVIAEALLSDRPVIATRCGGPEWMLTPEVGILVRPEDPDDLASAIEAAIRGGLRPVPGAARAHGVAHFSQERWLAEIEDVFARAVTTRRSNLP